MAASFVGVRWLVSSSLALMVGCNPDEPSDLENRDFLSERVTEGGTPRILAGATRLAVGFQAPKLYASAGCNVLEGEYSIEDGALVMSGLGGTLILCEGDVADQEDWYSAFLTSNPSITLEGDELVLEADGIRIEYLDRDVATPDFELVGHTWTVDALVDRSVASRSEWPSPATLVFDASGTVAIDTGCNVGSATYEAASALMWLRDFTSTHAACDGAAAELDAAVVDLFSDDTVSWRTGLDRLVLWGQGERGVELAASDG